MAIALIRRADGRRIARYHEKRSPQGGTPAATPVQSPGADPTTIPHDVLASLPPGRTTRALAGVVTVMTVFGVIILVAAVWQIAAWRRRRRRALGAAPEAAVAGTGERSGRDEKKGVRDEGALERPAQAVLVPPPSAADALWTPAIRSFRAPVPPASVDKHAQKPKKTMMLASRTSNVSDSPPPSYTSSLFRTKRHPVKIATPTPLPPSRPAQGNSVPSLHIQTEPVPVKQPIVPRPSAALPGPSHAGSVYGPPTIAPQASRAAGGNTSTTSLRAPKQAARLVAVRYPFEPTLPDELAIDVGETVRLMEEYRDGWCLVQHGTHGSEGVVPRFCLEEHTTPSAHGQHEFPAPRAI